jgi:hypothetical protein
MLVFDTDEREEAEAEMDVLAFGLDETRRQCATR